MYGALSCIASVCPSVQQPEDTLGGCKSNNLGTGGVRTDLLGAKVTWVNVKGRIGQGQTILKKGECAHNNVNFLHFIWVVT